MLREEVLLFLSDDRIDLLASDGNEPGAEDLIRRYYRLLAAPNRNGLQRFKCNWPIAWKTMDRIRSSRYSRSE